MPTTASTQWTVASLLPLYDVARARQIPVKIAASQTLVKGTILGEVTASPGTYKAYASGNSDGTQTPRGILAYDVTTDGSGVITNIGDYANPSSAPMYVSGTFDASELTGLDANAVTKLGGFLPHGDTSTGTFRF